MKTKSIAMEKSINFSVRIYKLYKHLCDNKKEFVLSKQILRSGTSIGANLAEARNAFSDKDFLAKVYISYKECNETLYWIELLKNVELIDEKEFESINTDCEELIKILTSTIKTLRKTKCK